MMLDQIYRSLGLGPDGKVLKPLKKADPRTATKAPRFGSQLTGNRFETQEKPMETQNEPEKKPRRAAQPSEDGAKTVGVQLKPALYERLMRLKERQNIGSLKEAALVAIDAGLRALGL